MLYPEISVKKKYYLLTQFSVVLIILWCWNWVNFKLKTRLYFETWIWTFTVGYLIKLTQKIIIERTGRREMLSNIWRGELTESQASVWWVTVPMVRCWWVLMMMRRSGCCWVTELEVGVLRTRGRVWHWSGMVTLKTRSWWWSGSREWRVVRQGGGGVALGHLKLWSWSGSSGGSWRSRSGGWCSDVRRSVRSRGWCQWSLRIKQRFREVKNCVLMLSWRVDRLGISRVDSCSPNLRQETVVREAGEVTSSSVAIIVRLSGEWSGFYLIIWTLSVRITMMRHSDAGSVYFEAELGIGEERAISCIILARCCMSSHLPHS